MRKEYDKLVRDRIPDVIRAAGKRCGVEVMDGEAYARALRGKLVEEAAEAAAAPVAELAAELGDVLEVVAALAAAGGLTMEDVEAARRAKLRDRGGFGERIRLAWVDDGRPPPPPSPTGRSTGRELARGAGGPDHGNDADRADAFAGIDVAFAKGKPLPVCVCVRRGGRLAPLPLKREGPRPPRGRGNAAALEPAEVDAFAGEVLGYLRGVEAAYGVRVRAVALDAPSAPKKDGLGRRAAERAMDARRLSCFATPSDAEFDAIRRKARVHLGGGGAVSRLPHANQLWMLVGFALFDALGRAYECVEVYPQATAAALGAAGLHKSKAAGLRAQLGAVAKATGWTSGDELGAALDAACFGSAHDKADAFSAAWVASLPEAEREACGEPPGDVIWVPSR